MNYLFRKTITDWNSWGAVFQSIEDFRELIKEIFIRENLTGYEQISHLTPGSNAVFKVGSYVIKIFAPTESSANTDYYYHAELTAMKRAIAKGINTPRVIAASYIQDKYLFRYIIMDYIKGKEAGRVLKDCSIDKKVSFVHELKTNLQKINRRPNNFVDGNDLIKRAIHNEKWSPYPESVKKQIYDVLTDLQIENMVYVHGDLTAENVMIDEEESLYIIDFADSTIAPVEYEYPPIIMDLFDFDRDLTLEFMKGMELEEFIDRLFVGTLLHEFGAFIIKDFWDRCTSKKVEELTDIFEIKALMFDKLKN
ncbi:hypothetical protein GCM10008967_30500 [Bacillus carboniphilus]|uniref:Protein kinase domain-containing protein n=1 Tax=Bacillus carboniphilus TaxID=86663 RepID=A0ABN0WHN4_9BACI